MRVAFFRAATIELGQLVLQESMLSFLLESLQLGQSGLDLLSVPGSWHVFSQVLDLGDEVHLALGRHGVLDEQRNW